MKYKLICTDIDGTLLNKDRELADKTIAAFKKVDKLGIPTVLISARMPSAMKHLQLEMGIEKHPLVCYNGGLVMVDGQIVSSTEIPLKILDSLNKMNRKNTHLSLYFEDQWYVPSDDFWTKREVDNTRVTPQIKTNEAVHDLWKQNNNGIHKIMAMGEPLEIDEIALFLEENFPNQLHLYRSKDTYLEIASKSISKLSAIEFLIEKYIPCQLSETVAFGDNFNDIEMLNAVGCGVAVANAKPEVIAIANHITDTNKENGVANFLENLLG